MGRRTARQHGRTAKHARLARSLLFMPLIGLVLGGESGGMRAQLIERGFDDQFASDLNQQLRPGGSAILLLTDTPGRDLLLHELTPHGGTLLHTTVSIDMDVLPLVREQLE